MSVVPRRTAQEGYADLVPLTRPGPLRTAVLDSLRELIIARTLAPGQHLVEAELAERLDVSRGPVREALQGLQALGWVELRPGRGAFVRDPTPPEVDEVFAVRAALEGEAAGLAAARAGRDDVAAMREICDRGRAAVAAEDEAAVVSANSELHRRIADLSGIRLLTVYIEDLDLRVRWFYKPVVRTRGTDSWDEHDRLIDAIAARDAEQATTTMRLHTDRTRVAYRAMAVTGEES